MRRFRSGKKLEDERYHTSLSLSLVYRRSRWWVSRLSEAPGELVDPRNHPTTITTNHPDEAADDRPTDEANDEPTNNHSDEVADKAPTMVSYR
jgi:hypothetical protein